MIIIKEKVLENIIKKYKKLLKDKIFLFKNNSKKKNKHSKLYYKIELLFNNLNSYKKFDFSEKISEKLKGKSLKKFKLYK